MRFAPVLVVLAGCFVSVDVSGTDFLCADGECPEGYRCNAEARCEIDEPGVDANAQGFRVPLTIAGPSEALVNFPLRVHLDASRIDFDAAGSGDSLYFTDANGDVLDHEVESWTPPTAEVFVLVPSVASATVIDMHYGGPTPGHGSNVWADYRAVFHLDGIGNSAAAGYSVSDNGTTSVAGQVGRARDFAAGYLDGGSNVDFLAGAEAVTISAWVKPGPGTCSDDCTIFGASVGSGNQARSRATLDFNVARLPNLGVRYDDTLMLTTEARAADPLPVGEWTWIAGTADLGADRMVLYVNGTQVAVTAGAGLVGTFDPSPSLQIAVGIDENLTSGGLLGEMDELRVRLEAMPGEWIATQYAALTDTLITFGAATAK